jgi:outer membrane protein assembly factor BamE (lipoprotein component of BamABCDE complex)
MNCHLRFLIFAATSAIALTSCATSPQERWSHMEVGMTKQQVLALLGEPVSTTSNGALVTMEYDFAQQQPGIAHRGQPGHTSCYVMMGRDDRVRSFGNN